MNFDPIAVCRILNEERVDYVVVGGFASVILGSPAVARHVGLRRHEAVNRPLGGSPPRLPCIHV